MKKLLLSLTVLFLLNNVNQSFAQQNTFSKVYSDASSMITGYAVTQAFDNGFMVVGENTGFAYLMKIDSAGNYLWGKDFGSNYNNDFYCITKTNDSCFLISGALYNNNLSYSKLCCIKVNRNGDTLWSKTYSTGSGDFPAYIQQTYDHGYIITGSHFIGTAPYDLIMAMKIDSIGNLQWRKDITIGNNENIGSSIKQTPDSGYVITTYVEDYPPFDANAALIKLSSTGTIQWTKKYNQSSGDISRGLDLIVTPSGIINYIDINGDGVLMKTDFTGNILWSYQYYGMLMGGGNSNYNLPTNKIHPTRDGNFILSFGGDFSGGSMKIDSLGNVIWANMINDKGQETIEAKDSGYLSLGNGPIFGVSHSVSTNPQIGIVKTDSLGFATNCVSNNNTNRLTVILNSASVTPTISSGGTTARVYPSITNSIVSVDLGCVAFLGKVTEPGLKDSEITIYPNPATSTFTIETVNSKIENIKVFNVLGAMVNDNWIMVNNTCTVDMSAVSKGIYFVQITGDDNNVINKKIVIR